MNPTKLHAKHRSFWANQSYSDIFECFLTFFDLFFLCLATVSPCLVGVASVVALAIERGK